MIKLPNLHAVNHSSALYLALITLSDEINEYYLKSDLIAYDGIQPVFNYKVLEKTLEANGDNDDLLNRLIHFYHDIFGYIVTLKIRDKELKSKDLNNILIDYFLYLIETGKIKDTFIKKITFKRKDQLVEFLYDGVIISKQELTSV